jgi:type II secretory pathway component PulK
MGVDPSQVERKAAANSSPPRRAATDPFGSAFWITSAVVRSRLSPVRWPWTSLIVLKPSRSTISIATARLRLPAAAISSFTADDSERRLRKPVSGSVEASDWARFSAAVRSTTSCFTSR